MKRSDSVGISSTLARLGIVILLAAAAVDGMGSALAQDATDGVPAVDSTPPGDDEGAPPRPYFQQFPDEPGAQAFDDLTAAEKDAVMFMAERTDYGPAVHGAWSAVAQSVAADAAARQAAHASGMNGIDDVGVR